jgi:hypothetical protein
MLPIGEAQLAFPALERGIVQAASLTIPFTWMARAVLDIERKTAATENCVIAVGFLTVTEAHGTREWSTRSCDCDSSAPISRGQR